MRSHQKKARLFRAVTLSLLAGVSAVPLLFTETVWAGQRQFLVILANSPKQYPNPARVPRGQPGGGLPNPELIRQQYFDNVSDNEIGSFAEYWREISYGDVTISGDVTDWIDLPWAIQPPLMDPSRDVPGGNPPVLDNLADPRLRNSPANFFDLSRNGFYEYGEAEEFNNSISTTILDLDGNPNQIDNGPFFVSPGSQHQTFHGFPVWKPGERFIDMDNDRRWDGLDECGNQMDFFGGPAGGPDGKPDLSGPWVDLNANGIPENETNCQYLPDSDNDGNPDCCPDGPGKPGCEGIGPDGAGTDACRPTTWAGPNNATITDCNGNLIPDACDLSCTSPACLSTGWTGPSEACGNSKDRLPVASTGGGSCETPTVDQIPDECQYVDPETDCVATVVSDPIDPCAGKSACTRLAGSAARTPVARCEYSDSNISRSVDIVEPYENFMRRWDPCLFDPDVSAPNLPPSPRAHWIKVYDPRSPFATATLTCQSPAYTVRYNDPSYIKDNYPAKPSDQDELIAEAADRAIYQQHDPLGKLGSVRCTCRDGTACIPTVTLPNSYCLHPPCTITKACIAGYHSQFDPPDAWTEVEMTNSPGGAVVRTAKIQAAPGVGGEAKFIDQVTPEPGDPPYPWNDTSQTKWYPQAWEDRYGDTCADPADRTGQNTVPCQAPLWTKDSAGQGRTHLMRPFTDVDAATYNSNVNRRYFHANRGGLNRDGTGWVGCVTALDRGIIFETGPLGAIGFEQSCNRVILPEETRGASLPGVFFDGYVEHDDLPSSKYHMAGDQRLGEVTSPYNTSIYGQDRGMHDPFSPPTLDVIIAAAGPYAMHVHGNLGRDAGNVLLMELLTWRTRPPFNNGDAWQTSTIDAAFHPYAYRENKGFRDYNLDGLVDQGESRYAGSENYQADSETTTTNNGVDSLYPFNRDRLMEDAVAILDDLVDFDDFVDPVALGAVTCPGPPDLAACLPVQLGGTIFACVPALADGILSGIALLPPGAHAEGDFNLSPQFLPIHNEDNDNRAKKFPQSRDPATKQTVSWNLFFFNLVYSLGVPGERTVPSQDFQTVFAAHEYLHGWEHFPDLYDYDVYAPEPRPVINCPVGRWDIMAGGGLVHPVPILKEKRCTEWTSPIDLTTLVTPGVDATLTLPPAEFVRDDSYLFLENNDRLGERYYLWSAGSGFDEPRPGGGMPGAGMLILHTDVGSNPDALPPNQTNGTRVTYLIVQSDGLHELEAGQGVDQACGDSSDPWPGSANKRRFNFSTSPSATWYTQNTWTGLDILDVQPDDSGSMQVKLNWVPTSVPSLKFIDPPGGVTVGTPPSVIYNIRTEATDVYGGTWVRLFYTLLDTQTPDPAAATSKPINPPSNSPVRKTAPGTSNLSINWNIAGIADGRYFLFADLIPDLGADGTERKFSTPRAGRNNQGSATLQVLSADVLTSTITNGTVTGTGKARSETWTMRCTNSTTGEWVVNSSLTHPAPAPGAPGPDPSPRALTGQKFTSAAGGVSFTIQAGTGAFPKGALGDTFTFTTTGITAPSAAVTILNGQIREGPTAIIDASPLSGPPPLEVTFDARRSVDPNGQPLTFQWTFGDSATGTGAQVSHTYPNGGSYTVTLRATNPANGRYGEASVDINVTNNSPNAVIKATPMSGGDACGNGRCLTVRFSATQSSDLETPVEQLIYQWDYGDGVTANDAKVAGILREPEHTYSRLANGTLCTTAAPCAFTATLKVTDGGGKTATDTVVIRVGNSNPVVNITTTTLQGLSPLTVTFNAKGSADPENDNLEVEWMWGDDTPNEKLPAKTGKPPATDGSVPHTFTLPVGTTSKTYQVKATVRDLNAGGSPKGGEAIWSGAEVAVFSVKPPPTGPNRPPTAIFAVNPVEAFVNQVVNFDASGSSDPDGDELRYRWVFGDGSTPSSFTANPRTTNTYASPGSYLVRLTVRDAANASSDATQTVRVLSPGENRSPVAVIATGLRTGSAPLTLTFDGSISFDPDGDTITFAWEFRQNGELIDPIQTGSEVTRVFETAGAYTVELVVRDVDGLEGRSGTEPILVTEPSQPPPPEPPPPRPGPQEPPSSAAQRPASAMCGLGMLMSVFGSLLGLTLTVVTRRPRERSGRAWRGSR